MDILLTLIPLTQKEFDDYAKQIRASNLSKITQCDLIEILRMAVEQTQQAKNMGWL